MTFNTFPKLFQNAAQVAGDAKIYFNDEVITYAELELETRRVARGLAKLGVGAGDRVGVWLPKTPIQTPRT